MRHQTPSCFQKDSGPVHMAYFRFQTNSQTPLALASIHLYQTWMEWSAYQFYENYTGKS